MRAAIYSPAIGYPLIYRSLADAQRALANLDTFPDAHLYRVYHYRSGSESPSYPDSRAGGVGGIWRDFDGMAIVLDRL